MKKIILIAATIAVCVGCLPRTEAPKTDYTPWVKAYTSGQIREGDDIRVVLAQPALSPTPDGVISFSPSLKGRAKWNEDKTELVFTPEAGALGQGRKYTATLALNKAYVRSDLPKFQFRFASSRKDCSVSLDNMIVDPQNRDLLQYNGTLLFSEPVKRSDLSESMITCSVGGEVEISSDRDESDSYAFSIKKISRGAGEKAEISFDFKSIGFPKPEPIEITLPTRSGFFVVGARRVDVDGSPYIEVVMNDLIATGRDLEGIVELEGVLGYYCAVEGNIIKVYHERKFTDLSLRIDEMLKNIDGRTMKEDYFQSFEIKDIYPSIEIVGGGNILPDPDNLVLKFKARNLKAVDVQIIKIYEENILRFLQENKLSESSVSGLRQLGRLVYKTTLPLGKDEDYSLDLSGIIKQEPGAIYRIRLLFNKDYYIYSDVPIPESALLSKIDEGKPGAEEEAVWDVPYGWGPFDEMDWDLYDWKDRNDPTKPTFYMSSERYPSVNLFSSNVGLIAKSLDDKTMTVIVTDILDAQPIQNAKVTVYNYQLHPIGEARTDRNGFAKVPIEGGKPFIVGARTENSAGYLGVKSGDENPTSSFDVSGQAVENGIKGYVFGERGVWRPGDTVHLFLVVNDRNGYFPENHPVTMELFNPYGQSYVRMVTSEGKDGFYRFDIETDEDVMTGTWSAIFTVGGVSFSHRVPIETIKPNRLKINFSLGQGVLRAGRRELLEVQSNWLTGPAAQNLKTRVQMTVSPARAAFEEYKDYNFINPTSKHFSEKTTLYEGALDENGQLLTRITMPEAFSAPGFLRANLVCRVFEKGGDASIATADAVFSPFERYVGIKLEPEYETDVDLAFPVVLIDREGRALDRETLNYKIWKMSGLWWWEASDYDYCTYVQGGASEPVAEGVVRTDHNGQAQIPFRLDYPLWGKYFVYVYDPEGGHACGGDTIIDWPSWRGRSDREDPNSLTMLTFSTDKDEYVAGETATVYIPAAEGARALVSIESSCGILSAEWVDTSADSETRYRFPITADMAPNCYVSISLIKAFDKCKENEPLRLYGVRPILVSDYKTHLGVDLDAPDVITPGERFTIRVEEKDGRDMSYVLAIVDEGLLDLTDYKTPDVWSAMNLREALATRTWDMYNQVVGAYNGRFGKILSIGGDMALMKMASSDANQSVKRFEPVVGVYGPYEANGGRDEREIELPNYVGSVRMMVIAGKDGAYGKAEKTVPVRSPLMVQPTLPRTVGMGETIVLPVNVFALEDEVRDVKLRVKTSGPLAIKGGDSQDLKFEKTGDRLVRFSLVADENKGGAAQVVVLAESGGVKAADTINIMVRACVDPVTSVQTMYLEAGEEDELEWTPFKSDESNFIKLGASRVPAFDFQRAYDYFDSYYYCCSEQISSKMLTYLSIGKYLSETQRKAIGKQIPLLVRELCSRQNSDGGFVYWPGNRQSEQWVSSMAGQALVEAENQGYEVPQDVMEKWARYQKQTARYYRLGESLPGLDQAYRLYTLALCGQADFASMNRLREKGGICPQAASRLASAYALSGRKNVAAGLIEDDPAAWSFDNLRDYAMLLEDLILCDRKDLAAPLALDLAVEIDNNYCSTQVYAFASSATARMFGGEADALISLSATQGEKTRTLRSAVTPASFDVVSDEGSLILSNSGKEPVYISCVGRRVPPFGYECEEKSRGIEIDVEYTDINGQPLDPENLRQGDEINVRIEVENYSYKAAPDLALTFPVPSGWEIFNDRLYASGEDGSALAYRDIRDDRIVWYFGLESGKEMVFNITCQASYEGVFYMPAIRCEDMYKPEFNANTTSSTVLVTR